MHAAMVLRETGQYGLWVGESGVSQWVRSRLWEVAQTGLPVLILGEPGSGRRLAARLVHGVSHPLEAPFVRVECGRLHAAQAEGVLFGGVELGAFERAQGGTLLLEEIEGLPLPLQERMCQGLATGRWPCPGERAPEPLAVRVMAATDQDLGKQASAGRFCPELFVRLALAPVRLPPLRQRRQDIPLLADYFLAQIAARLRQGPPRLSQEAMVELQAYAWPGNVWELKRVLERAVVRVGDGEITAAHVQQLLRGTAYAQEGRGTDGRVREGKPRPVWRGRPERN
jgi:DNA-binding NtrC family response regulator